MSFLFFFFWCVPNSLWHVDRVCACVRMCVRVCVWDRQTNGSHFVCDIPPRDIPIYRLPFSSPLSEANKTSKSQSAMPCHEGFFGCSLVVGGVLCHRLLPSNA
uniref:Putative secreted protein n=1 Tax=Anopheles darlingi TaxID=43151 RepID=A0A2M4D3W6_ANODA